MRETSKMPDPARIARAQEQWFKAASLGDEQAMRRALEAGARATAYCSKRGGNALMLAARARSWGCCELALSQAPSRSWGMVRDYEGKTAVSWALKAGWAQGAERLMKANLERGAEPIEEVEDMRDWIEAQGPKDEEWRRAESWAWERAIKKQLWKQECARGGSLASMAVEAQNVEALERLRELGVDWEKRGPEAAPVLFVALKNRNNVAAMALLRLGAKATARNAQDETALWAAVEAGVDPRVIEALMQRGADPLEKVKVVEWLSLNGDRRREEIGAIDQAMRFRPKDWEISLVRMLEAIERRDDPKSRAELARVEAMLERDLSLVEGRQAWASFKEALELRKLSQKVRPKSEGETPSERVRL